MAFDPILGLFFGMFGLAFGSFLNVCIHRLPRRIMLLDEAEEIGRATSPDRDQRLSEVKQQLRALSISRTRSACPGCKQPIAWYDNVPLLSWLILGGRCRRCRARISPRYIIVEALTAALFVACYAEFGLTLSAVKFCALSFFVVGLVFTDGEWKLLPDALTLPGLAMGVAFSLLTPVNDLAAGIVPLLARAHPGQPWRLVSLEQSLLGAFAGAAFIYGSGMLYLRMRPDLRRQGREAIGLGDVKLMAMVGAYLGLTLTIFTLFAASIAGAVFGVGTVAWVWMKRKRRLGRRPHAPARAWQSAMMAFRYFQVPFGVFLGSMAMLAVFLGDGIIRWYSGFFS